MRTRWGVVAIVLGAGACVGLACSGDGPPSILISPVSSGNAGDASSGGGSSSGSSTGSSSSSSGDTSSSSSSGTSDSGADVAPLPQAATPTFTPPSGTLFNNANNHVTIASATSNATIYFTTDGTEPTTSSSVYTGPLTIMFSTTIRAIAVASGFQPSSVATATFLANPSKYMPAPVAFNPLAGELENAVAIGLSTTAQGATICCTVTGVNPTCSQGSCTNGTLTFSAGSPIVVDAPPGGGAVTVKAMQCSAGNSNSDVTTGIYTFKVAPVSIAGAGTNTVTPYNPTSGSTWSTSNSNETFTFQTATLDETIRYAWASADAGLATLTCDQPCTGTLAVPDATCTVCSDSEVASGGCVLDVPPSTTINAVGCKAGYASSPLRTLVYAAP